jgi:hypothetical protein
MRLSFVFFRSVEDEFRQLLLTGRPMQVYHRRLGAPPEAQVEDYATDRGGETAVDLQPPLTRALWVRIARPRPSAEQKSKNLASIVDAHRRPSRDLVGAILVLVAADIEAGIVFARGAILANVRLASDLHDGAQLDARRAGDRIVASANVGAGGRDAGCAVGLGGNGIEAGNVSPQLVKGRRRGRVGGRRQCQRDQRGYRRQHHARSSPQH